MVKNTVIVSPRRRQIRVDMYLVDQNQFDVVAVNLYYSNGACRFHLVTKTPSEQNGRQSCLVENIPARSSLLMRVSAVCEAVSLL